MVHIPIPKKVPPMASEKTNTAAAARGSAEMANTRTDTEGIAVPMTMAAFTEPVYECADWDLNDCTYKRVQTVNHSYAECAQPVLC